MSLPELRTDPISGHRVVVAPGRAARPGGWEGLAQPDPQTGAADCPFCEGREGETPPEIRATGRSEDRADGPGWRTRLVPNKFPAFVEPTAAGGDAPPVDPLFPTKPAVGSQDVVIHTPEHRLSLTALAPESLADISALWSWRAGEGAPPDTVYTHVVVNEGAAAGASLPHSHSQLFSLPFVPPRVAGELDRQADSGPGCVVCRLIAGEVGRRTRLILERDGLVAYCPHAGRFPYETVVTPLECEVDAFASHRLADALRLAVAVLRGVRAVAGWAPANLWLTSSPRSGPHTHWRLTLVARLTTPAGLELGADVTINPLPPEVAAAALRDALQVAPS